MPIKRKNGGAAPAGIHQGKVTAWEKLMAVPNELETAPDELELLIGRTARTLLTVAPHLPTLAAIQSVLAIGEQASKRGYFLPDEDEMVRVLFSNYLTTRAALLSTLQDLRPYALKELAEAHLRRPELFVVSYCAACLLMRAGRFLVDSFRKQPVIWKKLDEAEPRYGIPAKQFTRVYRSLSSLRNVWTFLEASRLWQEQKDELRKLNSHPIMQPVMELLAAEEPWIETSKRYYTQHQLKYRWHSFLRSNQSGFRNVTFALFKMSGVLISEVRMQWKRKRVTPGVQRKLARMLQAGDVLITRHDDAASNLFLPGYWPHGALYIGTVAQRAALEINSQHADEEIADPICVLEARKDGVLFRKLSDTLSVDALVLLRPKLAATEIRDGIMRAMTHAGKQYDFEFDFRRTDKLVCTEVIYRAFHGCGQFRFALTHRRGRVCLSAEDLLDAAIDQDYFEVIAVYGVGGNRFVMGDRAREVLIKSYRK